MSDIVAVRKSRGNLQKFAFATFSQAFSDRDYFIFFRAQLLIPATFNFNNFFSMFFCNILHLFSTSTPPTPHTYIYKPSWAAYDMCDCKTLIVQMEGRWNFGCLRERIDCFFSGSSRPLQ